LEKKVAELVVALKKCQDEKKVAEVAAENSRKDIEKLQKTHDEDLKLIENLREDYDNSSKVAEDLRVNNADLAKTLSSKEQKIEELERALASRREASEREISEIRNKLELLFREYEKALNEFGVCHALFPADTEFKALPGVISGASDFAATFSVESILKLLHDFDCADFVKFRDKLSQFPDAASTSRLRPNEDVLAIKTKFAREFWLTSGKEVAKNIARSKLDQVNFLENIVDLCKFMEFYLLFSLRFSPLFFLAD
jgi:Rad3-related DNA helicase